jgi:uncharacterized protein with GYD domain
MPKYLAMAKFSAEALKGLRAAGAAKRVEVNRTAIESLGGKLECYYYAFGDHDVYAVIDLPDDEAATAASLTVNETGLISVQVVKLLTAEQVDDALSRSPNYQPPTSS